MMCAIFVIFPGFILKHRHMLFLGAIHTNKELPVSIVETFNETSKAKLFINVNGLLIQESV